MHRSAIAVLLAAFNRVDTPAVAYQHYGKEWALSYSSSTRYRTNHF